MGKKERERARDLQSWGEYKSNHIYISMYFFYYIAKSLPSDDDQ